MLWKALAMCPETLPSISSEDSDEEVFVSLPAPAAKEKAWNPTPEKELAARHEANGAWKARQKVAKLIREMAFELRHEKLDVPASLEALATEIEGNL